MVEHILLRFLVKYNDFISIYKMLIYRSLHIVEFCENFADFVHRYADSGSSYQTEPKSNIKV